MNDFSVAFTPDKKSYNLVIYMNVRDLKGNLCTDDHVLFSKKIKIPVNAWNLILSIDEEE